jgi:hypothetical protein
MAVAAVDILAQSGFGRCGLARGVRAVTQVQGGRGRVVGIAGCAGLPPIHRHLVIAQILRVDLIVLGAAVTSVAGVQQRVHAQLDALGQSGVDAIGGDKIGYARVSTPGQLLRRQIDALTAAGCRRVFAEKLSGRTADRPELRECLEFVQVGDTVAVTELARLGDRCTTCSRSLPGCADAN